MDDPKSPDRLVPNNGQQEEAEMHSLEWLLRKDNHDIIPAPMDTNISLSRQHNVTVGNVCSPTFTRQRLFEAASQGDPSQIHGLLDYMLINDKKLTNPEFTDEKNGKTALLKSLLNLKDGKNDTVEVFLDIAEKTGDLENLINTSYKDPFYRGQTALHIAIERRSSDHVKLLVQKGADVQAKANGTFFQRKAGFGFYFGELPLSLAACTNQANIVSFLVENTHRRAELTAKDSQGNTVLHTLVVIADNTTENTDMIAKMYDYILIQQNKLDKTVRLEELENNCGLTPLKLAAKLGKIGLFKHILHREFAEEGMRPLSRKITEWVYGPVQSSLYDIRSIDTNEENSVLEIVVFGSEISNRPEMLQIEPLCSLLRDKWDRYASTLFFLNFVAYVIYLSILTTVAFHRKEGQPPFPIEHVPVDYFRCVGELITVFGAAWFLYKAILIFKRNPPNFKALYTEGFCDILFFMQASLHLICAVMYCCGRREYVCLLVLSLALAWINLLYYSRGSKQLGMYGVMMQRMILGDLWNFLCVYGVLLFGFSAAIVSLIEDPRPAHQISTNSTGPRGRGFFTEPFECKKPSYNDISFTTLELFKFTIGMGDLEFTDNVPYKEVFYILLILYILLTYILLLNLLIALMGYTVETISKESENIWNLQRAFTILDMERTVPWCLTNKLYSGVSQMVCFRSEQNESRRFVRVEEMNWRQWRSDLGYMQDEDPGNNMTKPRPKDQTSGSLWNHNTLWEMIRARRRQPDDLSMITVT